MSGFCNSRSCLGTQDFWGLGLCSASKYIMFCKRHASQQQQHFVCFETRHHVVQAHKKCCMMLFALTSTGMRTSPIWIILITCRTCHAYDSCHACISSFRGNSAWVLPQASKNTHSYTRSRTYALSCIHEYIRLINMFYHLSIKTHTQLKAK